MVLIWQKLELIAEQIKREMDQIKGVADLGIFRVLGQPNLNIRVDRDKAARYGLNTGDVTTVVQAALGHAWASDCHHVLMQSGRADRRIHAFYEELGFEPGLRIAYVARRPG